MRRAGSEWSPPRRRRRGQARGRTLRDLQDLRVLVVDDNPASRVALENCLKSWGMQPRIVGNARAAQELVERHSSREQPFAVALIDAHMPGSTASRSRTGCDAKERAASAPRSCCCTRSTGRRTWPAATRSAAAYVNKPIDHSELFDTLLALLVREDENGTVVRADDAEDAALFQRRLDEQAWAHKIRAGHAASAPGQGK